MIGFDKGSKIDKRAFGPDVLIGSLNCVVDVCPIPFLKILLLLTTKLSVVVISATVKLSLIIVVDNSVSPKTDKSLATFK